MGVVICPKCGLKVSNTTGECFACGAPLPKEPRRPEPNDFDGGEVNLNRGSVNGVEHEEKSILNEQTPLNTPFQQPTMSTNPVIAGQSPNPAVNNAGFNNQTIIPESQQPLSSFGQNTTVTQQPVPPTVPPQASQVSNPQIKKNSVLSIVALVLSFIPYICMIALVLAIIDLVKNKNNKHGFAIAAIVISSLMFLGSLGAGGRSSNVSEPTPSDGESETVVGETLPEEVSDSVEEALPEEGSDSVEEATATEEMPTESVDTETADEATVPTAEFVVTASEVYKELEDNQVACKSKYNGKIVELTGIIGDIGTNIYGQEYISYETGDTLSLEFVTAYFRNSEMDSVANVTKGMRVTVIGTASIGSMSFKLGDCVIKEAVKPTDEEIAEQSGIIKVQQELYNKDGIIVEAVEFNKGSVMGPELKIYVENNSDKDIEVRADTITINGYVVDGYFHAEVQAGKKANESLSIYETSLESNSISNVENMEFILEFTKAGEWDPFDTSDTISIQIT